MQSRFRFFLSLLLALAFCPSGAIAQSSPDPRCRDGQNAARCAEEQHRRVLGLFGARPIEEHVRAGDQLRRAFFVDGYDRDLIAIEFVRTVGREPIVRVLFPSRRGRPAPSPIEAPVPAEIWDAVIERSRYFHRRFAPEPPRRSDEIIVSSHCWLYTIEAVDPPRDDDPADVRRKVESACEHGPGQPYAQELARAALPMFPYCVEIDRGRRRSNAYVLSDCGLLSGDREAAAEVMNRAGPLHSVRGPRDVGMLDGLFAYRAQFDWDGERHARDGNGASYWAAKRATPQGDGSFRVESVRGESANRVRMTAIFETWGAADNSRSTAPVELVWIRERGGLFQIEQVSVGAIRPTPLPLG